MRGVVKTVISMRMREKLRKFLVLEKWESPFLAPKLEN